MTDLEMTRLCAKAMGYTDFRNHGRDEIRFACSVAELRPPYNPLHDDAQAMALVKKFKLDAYGRDGHWDVWLVGTRFDDRHFAYSDNLNRAIVECVAKAQAK